MVGWCAMKREQKVPNCNFTKFREIFHYNYETTNETAALIIVTECGEEGPDSS